MDTEMPERFDALACDISSRKVTRMYVRNTDLAEAETTVKFAVIRRGVETELHVVTRAGMYNIGDKYDGDGDGLAEDATE